MHIALLRGINVGGKNSIRMADLKHAFAALGFTDVRTYIQSGNVLFRGGDGSAKRIALRIEEALSSRFDYSARVVVKSKRQYQDALGCAPPNWGESPARKHNALFVVAGTSTTAILKELPPLRDELEEVTCGPGVIFWSGAIKGIARTSMMKIGQLPIYREVTVRNHKTTFRLLQLLDER